MSACDVDGAGLSSASPERTAEPASTEATAAPAPASTVSSQPPAASIPAFPLRTATPVNPSLADVSPEVEAFVLAARALLARGEPVTRDRLAAASPEVAALLLARQAVVTGDGLQVYLDYSGDAQSAEAALRAAGVSVELTASDQHLIQATVPLAAMDAVRALPFVTRVRLPQYGITNQTAGGVP
jgi:hypothetical protein